MMMPPGQQHGYSAQPHQAAYAPPSGYVLVKDAPKTAWVVPCVGILMIFFSLFMPYISVLGFDVTGFEMIELFMEGLANSDGGGDGGVAEDELPDDMPMLLLALLMLSLSPIFFCLMAIISTFSMLFKSHPTLAGVLHLLYFGGFMLCSVMSGVDAGILGDYSVHGDLAGMGFFIGGFAGILLCIKA